MKLCEPGVPLLTELKNHLAEPLGYKHVAPSGAGPSAQGGVMSKSGAARRSTISCEPGMPLLTELKNHFAEALGYKHGAPSGAGPSAQGGVMSRLTPRPSPLGFLLAPFLSLAVLAAPADTFFEAGTTAYRASDYARAAETFRQSVTLQPASGALQNLGNAEWQSRRPGAAILSWEQALWLDPFNQSARQNLRFARKTAQLEAPDLAWYEVISTWLPVSWWAWIAGISFWLAVAMGMLPGILRQPKATWHQAIAALGLMVFLLSVPAHIGVKTRSQIGFVLQKDTPLRLTPTLEAQAVTRLGAGEPARWLRARGKYVLIRTSHALGWVEQDQFSLTCPRTRVKAG